MPDLDHPLRLAVGTHAPGTGRGCVMNVLSWENGDRVITDFPACTDRLLAYLMQHVNDTHCTHRGPDPRHGGAVGGIDIYHPSGTTPDWTVVVPPAQPRLLCPPCSVEILDLGHRTVGTNLTEHGWTDEQTRELWLQFTLALVEPIWSAADTHEARATLSTVRRWLDNPKDRHAIAAAAASVTSPGHLYYLGAGAALVAAAEGQPLSPRDRDALIRVAAIDLATALIYGPDVHRLGGLIARTWAADCAGAPLLTYGHGAVDTFLNLTGLQPRPVDPDVTAAALAAMRAVTA